MSPAVARTVLHTAHLLTFVALLFTGVLLLLPGLRSAITGGYSLLIRDGHRWAGVAFVLLPVLIILGSGARSIFAPPAHRTARSIWQGSHILVTLLMGVVFTITGFILWGQDALPEPLLDTSLLLHDWLTYGALALLAIHLADVGIAALAARLQAAPAAPRSEI